MHFTSLSPHLVPENEAEGNQISDEYENTDDGEQLTPNSQSIRGSSSGSLECSSAIGDDPTVLEMIIVKDVKSGSEVSTLSYLFQPFLPIYFDLDFSNRGMSAKLNIFFHGYLIKFTY